MIAIISDIHGNLEALTTVLAEIDRRGVDRIVCLGDVIGYGPNPVECLDTVIRRCDTVLMGNHDFAVLYEPYNFNSGAESACFWTRRQFELDEDDDRRKRRWEALSRLPVRHEYKLDEEDAPLFMAVHASPRRPINEYIFPDDIYTNPGKFPSIFDRFETLCFCGHTHVPGVFLEGPDFYSPDELELTFVPAGEKAVVNVGSVGQPRDRDPRASFVLLDETGGGDDQGPKVTFVRLAYDIDAVAKKVQAIPALDNFLGSRLMDGR
ncbi:MAG: metallophosphoesterase family protein [Planctomycetota bacterium]